MHRQKYFGFAYKGQIQINLNLSAVPWLKRLVAGFPSRRQEFASGQHVGFVVDKAALGQVFSEFSSVHFSFHCQSSFHQFLHHHNHPGRAQLAYWWPQC
jgi:hypothetical protein